MHHQHARVRSASIQKLSLTALLTGALVCGTGLAPALAEPASPTPSSEASATTGAEASQEAHGVEAPQSTSEASPLPSAPSGQDRAARGAAASSDMTLTNERNTTDVVIELPEGEAGKELRESADTVHLRATMSYRGKVTREIDQRISLKDFTDDYYILDFKNFGKFTVELSTEKNGAVVRKFPKRTVGVTADSYVLAPVSATLPVAMFSLNLWGKDSVRKIGPVIAMFERPNAYDWNALPGPTAEEHGVYALPYLTERENAFQPGGFDEAAQQFRDRIDVFADYVRDLRELDPSSDFHLYSVDMFPNMVQKVIYANRIPQDQYTINLMTDGAYSYVKFADLYQGSNPRGTHERLLREWKEMKEHAYANGRADAKASEQWSTADYLWALVDSEPNAHWWLARPKLLSTSGDGNAFATQVQKSPKVRGVNISQLLSANIKPSKEATEQFKALYNFNDGYFSAAEREGKDVLLLLGTIHPNEQGFEDYARFTKSYYGDRYAYYYKGHPATPTEMSVPKQEQLKRLGMDDVDASIAAELILFFNPGIDIAGYQSSTFESTQPGRSKGVFNYTKGEAMAKADSPYRDLDFWIVPIDRAWDQLKRLCPGGHSCYQVEFSDEIAAREGYTHALWDATDSVIVYYKKQGDRFEKVRSQDAIGEKSSVEPGEYFIKSALADHLVLDVPGASRDDGANVQLWDANRSDAQKWRVSYDSQGLATITNVASGKVLDAQWGSSRPGTNVDQWSSNGTRAQKWRITSGDQGRVKIVSALDPAIVLDVAAANASAGANVGLWNANGSDAQAFSFIPTHPKVSSAGQADITPGFYELASVVDPTKAIDLKDFAMNNGARLQLWGSSKTDNQIWKISRESDGFYRLVNTWSNKSLDSTDGTPIPGTELQLWDTDMSNANQKWAIFSVTGGAYMLRNVGTGLVVNLRWGQARNGMAIDGYLANGTTSQQWRLNPVQGPQEILDQWAKENRNLVPDGEYQIRPVVAPNNRVEVQWASRDAGARVWSYQSNGSAAQKWRISHDDKGYVTLTNIASGKVLDVFAAWKNWPARVNQQPSNSSAAQKWVIQERGGHKVLVSALSPMLVLDLEGGRSQNETTVHLYQDNGSSAQRFDFLK